MKRLPSWHVKARGTPAACRCLAMILLGMAMVGALPAAARAGAAPEAAERYVRTGFSLQNKTGALVPEAELWVCAPLRQTSSQRLLDLNASHPFEEMTDGLGNHLLRFVFSNMPPYAAKIVTVEATLAMSAEPRPAEEEPGRWLQAGPLFEYTDEVFGRLAPEFPGGASEQTARAIFDWVRGHLQDGGYDGTDRGALHALTQRKGDCTEYATLFVALCRRAGIPARAMGGYVVGQNAVLDPESFHNWAEFLVEGRWRLADPHAGTFQGQADRHVATRVLGESDSPVGGFARFRYRGEGIQAVMTP